MKILYYSNFYTYGGGERYIADLAAAMARAGDLVTVLGKTGNTFGPRRDELHRAGVQTLRLPPKQTKNPIQLARIVRQVAPDIIHINESRFGVVGCKMARIPSPIIGTIHVAGADSELTSSWNMPRLLATEVLKLYTSFIAVSQAAKSYILRSFPMATERTTVIHNGVRIYPLQDTHRRNHVLCVGRLVTHEKGQDLLLDAWSRLSPQAWRLSLVGDGPDFEVLKERIARLGLTNVDLLGFRSDVSELLRAAKVVAVPSRFEGLSYAVLEGLEAGCVVVASSVGGIPEIISPGVNGFLVDRHPTALANGLQRAMNADFARMQGAARLTVQDRFHIETMVCRTRGVYQQYCP